MSRSPISRAASPVDSEDRGWEKGRDVPQMVPHPTVTELSGFTSRPRRRPRRRLANRDLPHPSSAHHAVLGWGGRGSVWRAMRDQGVRGQHCMARGQGSALHGPGSGGWALGTEPITQTVKLTVLFHQNLLSEFCKRTRQLHKR